MHLLADIAATPTTTTWIFLGLALALALGFEFVNGFHDTANAVATVIYTHSLKPTVAVVWSGLCNLAGVLLSNGLVAFSIVGLLPVELVLHVGSASGFAMVFALLISAIVWNLGTWYLGLPASSSHTLVGSIIGVGLANSVMTGHSFGSGVNWGKAEEVGITLLVSPVVGFVCSALMLTFLRGLVKHPADSPKWLGPVVTACRIASGVIAIVASWFAGRGVLLWLGASPYGYAAAISAGAACLALLLYLLLGIFKSTDLFHEPPKDRPPPFHIRLILFLTCTGVSFSHGSNDGQKGMGLIVLILVGILPGTYALKMDEKQEKVREIVVHSQQVEALFAKKAAETQIDPAAADDELSQFIKPDGFLSPKTYAAIAAGSHIVSERLGAVHTFAGLSTAERRSLRNEIYLVSNAIGKLVKGGKLVEDGDKKTAVALTKDLDAVTKYIPFWVQLAVACALGFGTMVGWKRIVVTVGEKIGKAHLTYGQGASAELIAAITIQLADRFGMPVSTTHVLSSGIAGTMAANGSGLQARTLRNILLAWVLTLPVCVMLGSLLFAFGNYMVLNILGLK